MSYKPLDKLQKQIRVEFSQLKQLLEIHRSLVEKCKTTKPDPIERSALAAMLHAFYTGVENILKRTALEINGRLPEGEFWHRKLLEEMPFPPPIVQQLFHSPLRSLYGITSNFVMSSVTLTLSTSGGRKC